VNIKSKTGGFLRNLYKWLYAGYLGKRFSIITENLFLAHNLWLTIFITITTNRVVDGKDDCLSVMSEGIVVACWVGACFI